MEKSFVIITNNPLVQSKYPESAEFLDAAAEGVLRAARDYVHLGERILSHPLSGGVLPGGSPYKSLLMTKTGGGGANQIDFQSLSLIEDALAALKKPPGGFEGYDGKTLEDFQVLDLDIIDSASKTSGLSGFGSIWYN